MVNEYVQKANKVSVISLIVNFLLSAFKFVAGVLAGSSAMISDSIHSLSDFFSTIIVMIGVTVSGKRADKDHPFGHERLECIASLILASILFATAILLGYTAVTTILAIVQAGEAAAKSEFMTLALIAGILSIFVKFAMYLFTEVNAKKISSSALHGDALHHLSDSLSSVGSVVGIVGAMLGVPLLDPIASLVICVMIFKAGIDIALMAVNQLVDKAADEKTQEDISRAIASVEGVKYVDVLRTRQYGNRIFVETEIGVDANVKLLESHRVAEAVHVRVEQDFPEVKHCMVHVNPVTEGGFEPDNHESPGKEW